VVADLGFGRFTNILPIWPFTEFIAHVKAIPFLNCFRPSRCSRWPRFD
jgi:hypothetical protein